MEGEEGQFEEKAAQWQLGVNSWIVNYVVQYSYLAMNAGLTDPCSRPDTHVFLQFPYD